MHLYITLLCIAVHPKYFTIMGGGGGAASTALFCETQKEIFVKVSWLFCSISERSLFMICASYSTSSEVMSQRRGLSHSQMCV